MNLKRQILALGLLLAAPMIGVAQTDVSQEIWSLERCINYAWDNNLTVKNTELTQLNNEIALKEAKFSRLPNLNGGGSLGKSFGRTIDPVSNRFVSQDFLSGGVSLNSNLTLYQGGVLRNSIKQTELDLEASQLDLDKAKNDISISVATNYLTVLLNNEQLNNARFQLEVTKQQLERTMKMVEAGSLPLTNQLDLESQLASNEVQVVNAENNVSIAMLNLKQAMQMPANIDFQIEVPEISVEEVVVETTDPDLIFETALKTQPEIKSAELGIESSEMGVKIAKGGLLPSLSVSGSISTNYSDQAREFLGNEDVLIPSAPIGFVQGTNQPVMSLPSTASVPNFSDDYSWSQQFSDNLGQSIRVNLSVPIFNRLSTKSNIQRAEINKQRAEISSQNTRNTLRQNVESAYTNALASYKSYQASQKRVAALQETFRATEQRYEVGNADFVDYQVASNNLFAAKADLTQSNYSFIFRVKILDFYLGKPITLD